MNTVSALFQVPELSCGHCRSRIEGALTPLEGVTQAVVDLRNKAISVVYDTAAVDLVQLVEAIEAIGYPVASARKVA